MSAPTTTHACPGGRGAQVARHMYACKPCWFRLPRNLRDAISNAWLRGDYPAHRIAMADAAQWYADHPRTDATKKPTFTQFIGAVLGDCIDHPHEQVGRCVYCKQCGRRLYQGSPMSADDLATIKEALALEAAAKAPEAKS